MSDPQSVPALDGMLGAGASVIVTSPSPEALEEALAGLAEGGRPVAGSACDVGELSQVEALLSFALHLLLAQGRSDLLACWLKAGCAI